jgi:hypothetical protein
MGAAQLLGAAAVHVNLLLLGISLAGGGGACGGRPRRASGGDRRRAHRGSGGAGLAARDAAGG